VGFTLHKVRAAHATGDNSPSKKKDQETAMEMNGEQLIPVPQAEVWRGLNDPEVLKKCIAGCESIEKVSDTEYRILMTAAVGPVKAKFTGKLLLQDLNPPNSYSIAFEGSGGAAGFGKGGASVKLTPEGSSTRLAYNAKATVGGKLAQIGSRLVDGVARKMADDFFVKFNAIMAGPGAAAAAATVNAVSDTGTTTTPAAASLSASESTDAGSMPIWVVMVTIAVMLISWWALGGGAH
jgi:carbon monoxide dehydrogenase subunit G